MKSWKYWINVGTENSDDASYHAGTTLIRSL